MIPETLTSSIVAVAPGRGVYSFQPFLSGIVETQYGMMSVTVGLSMPMPNAPEKPAQLVIQFPTKNVPEGLMYQVDATALLEGVARAYFAAAPTDRPLPPDPDGKPFLPARAKPRLMD